MLDDRLAKLRDRAARTLGPPGVKVALPKFRAIIGPSSIPVDDVVAQAALDKLHEGVVPTPEELAALEIVVRMLRPVVFTLDGKLGDLPDTQGRNLYPADLTDAWSRFQKQVEKYIGSVGRVESASDGAHVGSGFLVGPGLLGTNRHVLAALTFGTEVLVPGAARVVFKQENGRTNQKADMVSVDGVAAVHPTLDMVLLRVAGGDRIPIELDTVRVKEGDRIVVIGYPAEDKVNNPLFLASVFNGRYGVRRAALGEVLDGSASPLLYHDSSTTQGNSGSPVFSLASARVAGIHSAGFFMYRNEAVDADQLRAFIRSAGK